MAAGKGWFSPLLKPSEWFGFLEPEVWWDKLLLSDSSTTSVTPATGQLTVSGLAPSLTLGITAAVGSLIITGQPPTVLVTNNQSVIPGTGSLVISSFNASLGANQQVTAGIGSLIITGLSPTVSILISSYEIATGSVLISGFAPLIDSFASFKPALSTSTESKAQITVSYSTSSPSRAVISESMQQKNGTNTAESTMTKNGVHIAESSSSNSRKE